MHLPSLFRFLGLLLLGSLLGFFCAAQMGVEDLRCDRLVNPLGLDEKMPVFSWRLRQDSAISYAQEAYQILLATDPSKLNQADADVWNSGKTYSKRSAWIKYDGTGLRSQARYYWKLLVWRDKGKAPMESAVAFFQTGLMNPREWKARWIGLDTFFTGDRPFEPHSKLSARYFRKEFHINSKVKKATLYFTGLGWYELYLNGKKVGDQELSPALSDYRKCVYYNVFDVSDQFVVGNNTFGVTLGNGRFFSMRPGKPGEWKLGIPAITNFGYPKMILQLELEYENGQTETITSDSSWKVTADGPVRANNEYDGEVYDYDKEMPGWNKTSFDDAKWLPVDLTDPPIGPLTWQRNPNMRVMDSLEPVSIRQKGDGTYLVDMGQNMVGWLRLHLRLQPNTPVTIRYAERLKDDGSIYTDNLRSAEAKDSIVAASKEGSVVWEPAFVYHGFRYAEIQGVQDLSVDDIDGRVVYDEMATTGSFTCSDTMLNKIFKAAYWTISGNYKSMPVDCPQRDERMGWLGDRSINAYGESFLFDNYHLYCKWLDDIAYAQKENGSLPDVAPGYWAGFYSDNMTWPSSYLFVADMIYRQFGDDNPIKKHYPGMKKWMDFMKTFFTRDSLIEKDNYGDWCVPPESKELIISKDSTRTTPGGFIASAYYIYCLQMMTDFAAIVGNSEDSLVYSNLRIKMIEAVNKKYFDQKKMLYANNTVTANLLALSFNIVPPRDREKVVSNLAKTITGKYADHVSTGLIGNQWLMRGLANNGCPGIAYTIATNKTYPSWGYMLENGATTIWELWNGNTANPAMNSGNHVMLLGDLMIWYYQNLAGIKSNTPGYTELDMRPYEDTALSFVNASYKSIAGEIRSNWKRNQGKFTWTIIIPPTCAALIHVPAKSKGTIKINRKVKYIGASRGYYTYGIGSGVFQIVSEY